MWESAKVEMRLLPRHGVATEAPLEVARPTPLDPIGSRQARKGGFQSANEDNARMTDGFQIRSLNDPDPQVIAAAFSSVGWVKPIAQFQRYLVEQAAGSRICLVATVNDHFAGYVTVNWVPAYPR